jgi:hypothetical protein
MNIDESIDFTYVSEESVFHIIDIMLICLLFSTQFMQLIFTGKTEKKNLRFFVTCVP